MKEGNGENDFIIGPTMFSYRNEYHFYWISIVTEENFVKRQWFWSVSVVVRKKIIKTLCKCEYSSHKCTHIILHIKLVPSKHYWKKPSCKQKQKMNYRGMKEMNTSQNGRHHPLFLRLKSRIHTQATTIDCIYYISLQNGYLLR